MSNALALARRDLRGGWGSLWLLLVCLAIAVAGLAAVTSLASAIGSTIERNGRDLLGGDLSLSVSQRAATPAELTAIRALGSVKASTTLRSNMVVPSGDSLLVDLSAVEAGWPAAGKVALLPGGRMPSAPRDAAIGRELAERLNLRLGSPIKLGFADFTVNGIITDLPAPGGFALAPPVLITPAGLAATQLIQPGSLYSSSYRVTLPPSVDSFPVGKSFAQRFDTGGWRVTDKSEAAQGTRRFVERVGQLLLLIALGALGIGAIGIASAVSAFAASRRSTVAVLKIHGARRADLFAMLGLSVALLAVLAITVGLIIGAVAPSIVGAAAGPLLPVKPDPAPQWSALGLSAAFGLLVTLAAAWTPIERAASERPATILRGAVGEPGPWGWRPFLIPALAVAAIIALALATSTSRMLTLSALGVFAALTLIFAALGWLIARTARGLSQRGGPITRLGLAALHRPGAATIRLSIALGLGLALLVALSGIGSSLSNAIRSTVPQQAPALFLLDIPADGEATFRALANRTLPGAELRTVPSLRGPVTALNGRPVSEMRSIPEGAWILRGDRGLTFAGALPPGNRVVSGRWWPTDYSGPPLVSLDRDAATALNLKVGDTMTVAVLGRPIEARIANLREIDWRSMGFNFALIFAPGSLEGAPYTVMATVAPPRPGASTLDLERALARDLPMVSAIRVGEVVTRVSAILNAMDSAIRLATALAILIGVAVLAGAVAATRAARAREAVLLKLVGATRAQVLTSQLIEFLAMSGAIALAAFALGTGAGWAVVTQWFELDFAPDWGTLIVLPLAGVAVAVITALLAALPALLARPAEALRAL